MQRSPISHKGENGKVAVVGGSRFIHGAPLLCALGAEASGVDLITICLPWCHEEAAKGSLLNAFVHPFAGDDLTASDVSPIVELLATIDCAVLGPGVATTKESIEALGTIATESSCALVLDATALQAGMLKHLHGSSTVLTPHRGELERMGVSEKGLTDAATSAGITILLKGPTDRVAKPDGSVEEVEGGNAGLTVGGTGDVLAGVVCGLMAQGMVAADAAIAASRAVKQAGDVLFEEKGFAYTAEEVVAALRIDHGKDEPAASRVTE